MDSVGMVEAFERDVLGSAGIRGSSGIDYIREADHIMKEIRMGEGIDRRGDIVESRRSRKRMGTSAGRLRGFTVSYKV